MDRPKRPVEIVPFLRNFLPQRNLTMLGFKDKCRSQIPATPEGTQFRRNKGRDNV